MGATVSVGSAHARHRRLPPIGNAITLVERTGDVGKATIVEQYSSLAITNLDDLVFGRCPRPLKLAHGLTIGGGTVYPELNFTLPPMQISAATMPQVLDEYRQMIGEACARAVALQLPGLVVEFELLPDLTLEPDWGAEVTACCDRPGPILRSDGLPNALRVTPNDIREFVRPPLMREGREVGRRWSSFELCAQAGADLLSIESTGGKEVHDDALLNGDLAVSVFALGMPGLPGYGLPVGHDRGRGAPARRGGGGRQCLRLRQHGHGAGRHPAHPQGVGGGDPGDDGGAQPGGLRARRRGPGQGLRLRKRLPEGHHRLSHGHGGGRGGLRPPLAGLGNIAKATADLWSNESVQNVKLLGGMAPTVSVEQLAYATRLMNVASSRARPTCCATGSWRRTRGLDPQAYVLRPDVALKLAAEIVAEPTRLPASPTRRRATLAELRTAHQAGAFTLSRAEIGWLNRLSKQADQLPEDEDEFIASLRTDLTREKVLLDQYGYFVRPDLRLLRRPCAGPQGSVDLRERAVPRSQRPDRALFPGP